MWRGATWIVKQCICSVWLAQAKHPPKVRRDAGRGQRGLRGSNEGVKWGRKKQWHHRWRNHQLRHQWRNNWALRSPQSRHFRQSLTVRSVVIAQRSTLLNNATLMSMQCTCSAWECDDSAKWNPNTHPPRARIIWPAWIEKVEWRQKKLWRNQWRNH